MADKIEIAPKKAPPKIDVLARQIEALKNDTTPEKLETIEPRLTRLNEKVTIFKNSREQRIEELTKINEEFEKIREELKIKLFVERFEISEKVAKFMHENPDTKLEDLKAEQFTQNPEIQNNWDNVLEDALRGLETAKVLENPDFDWKNPKAYLEKSGEIGKEIMNNIDKHPIAAAICLIGGIYALYQFLRKDSSLWGKTKGVVMGGISTWLGFSLASVDLHKKGAEKLAIALAGKENVDFIKDLFSNNNPKGKNPDKNKAQPDEIPKASEVAKDSLEYLAGLMPESATALKALGESVSKFPPNLPQSKENIIKLYEAVKKEKGKAAIEISKSGIKIAFFGGLKLGKNIVIFSFKVGEKIALDIGNWMMQQENPWWKAGGFIVKADSWLIGAGVGLGVTKSIFEFYKKENFGLWKTPKHMVKGGVKGAIKGAIFPYHVLKNGIKFRTHGDSMMKVYKDIYQLKALETKELLWSKPKRTIQNPALKSGKGARQISKIKYFEKKAKLAKKISENMSSWASEKDWRRFREIEESAVKKANDLRASLPKEAQPLKTKTDNHTKQSKPKKVIDFAKEKARRAPKTQTQLRPTEQVKIEPEPVKKPHLKVVEKTEPLLKPQPEIIMAAEKTPKIKAYLDWCKNKGIRPINTEILKKRLATFGAKALELGATPLMIFLTIHNIESASPSQRNEAIAENASSLASFYLALKFGTAAFEAIPGPLLSKSIGAISTAMVSFFVGQKGIEELSSKILQKINLDFSEGSKADDALLLSETFFGLGGSTGFIKNLFHTGENAEEFLERDMPALFNNGEIISRFHYNNVGIWNERIQKRIKTTKSLTEKSFLETILINKDWQKMEAAKLSKLESQRNTSEGAARKQAEEKIENQKKFLKRIGQYDEQKFQDQTFIQEGMEKLLEQKTLANSIKSEKQKADHEALSLEEAGM